MTLAVVLAGLALALLALQIARRRASTIPLALQEPPHGRTEHRLLVAVGTLLVLGFLVIVGADRGKAAASNSPARTPLQRLSVDADWNDRRGRRRELVGVVERKDEARRDARCRRSPHR